MRLFQAITEYDILLSMSDTDSILDNESDWLCPVCKVSHNASREPLVSDWAVACHIAGKVRIGDRLHRSWTLSKAPDLDVKDKVFNIAVRLMWAVVEARRDQEKLAGTPESQQTQEPYNQLRTIEVRLHRFIEHILKHEYGNTEEEWWSKGIPLSIRQKCVSRREESAQRHEPYAYTDLIDLQSILNYNWRLFEAIFQHISKQMKSKAEFLNSIGKLNELRNIIMHPVREQEELPKEQKEFLNWFENVTSKFVADV